MRVFSRRADSRAEGDDACGALKVDTRILQKTDVVFGSKR
jgi:hypothetical protein